MRSIRNQFTLAQLRLKGCDVDWSATVHPTAVFERSRGTISIGARTEIDRGAIIRALGGSIKIGADCSINAYSVLSGSGGVVIGDSVMIASHVSMYASNHIFSDTSLPMQVQGLSMRGIVVCTDVWIGTGARILDGVELGRGCVIAAGAVVTKSTDPYTINGGVPARVIGQRMSAK
jgi:acetyltransferase-like isoleucine patch superfamily enzyme